MNKGAIGVFDSGLGGLTAVCALKNLLPDEDIIYLGDTLRVPYGDKERDELIACAQSDISFLLSKNVKAILIACGTVSSTLEKESLASYDVPIFEVLTPAVASALKLTKNKKIGVIATAASIRAGAYERALLEKDACLSVYPVACPRLVPLIESGKFSKDEVNEALCEYLLPLKEKGIDTLILGCTHYPLLKGAISDIMGDVNLIDIGKMAAESLKEFLENGGALSTKAGGSIDFYVSGDTESFKQNAANCLECKIEKIQKAVLK